MPEVIGTTEVELKTEAELETKKINGEKMDKWTINDHEHCTIVFLILCEVREMLVRTEDAASQLLRGRVGWGVRSPSTSPPPST